MQSIPSPENATQANQMLEDGQSFVGTYQDVVYDTDALVVSTQDTDALEHLPRIPDHRSILSEKRQSILQQKQVTTETLPPLTGETAGAKGSWRLMTQLREENFRLRYELAAQEDELAKVAVEYSSLQSRFDQEIAVVHTGHQQEVDQYQAHFRELLDERNRLQEAHSRLEQHYQQLYHSFQDVVEEEVQKRMLEAAYALEAAEEVPPQLQNVVHILGERAKRVEEKILIDALFLKREAESLVAQLQAQREELDEQRQQVLVMQKTAREQAELRQKTVQARMKEHWRVATLSTSVGLLVLLVVLQFVALALLHASVGGVFTIALLAPIIVCVLLALGGSQPVTMLKHIYSSAPHRKKN